MMKKRLVGGAILLALSSHSVAAQQSAPTSDRTNRLILLGTKGGPVVDVERSEPASLLVVEGSPYLIDAGTGTAHQLARAGFPTISISNVFITHHHLDHTAGLSPLLSLNWINQGLSGTKPSALNVYGPPGTNYLVKAAVNLLSVSERIFRAGIPSLPASETRFFGRDVEPGVVFQDGKVKVTAVENSHFSTRSTGPDGKQDRSYAYRFDTGKTSIVFTGDTGPSSAVNALAKGADILVSEVLLPRPANGARRPQTALGKELAAHMTLEHLTVAEVGKMAAAAGVKRVVLTHFAGVLTPEVEAATREEIRGYYKGEVVFGKDLMSIDLDAPKRD